MLILRSAIKYNMVRDNSYLGVGITVGQTVLQLLCRLQSTDYSSRSLDLSGILYIII